jgi:NADH:ubiquinone oxidoreductase subunit F (NADH-binding)
MRRHCDDARCCTCGPCRDAKAWRARMQRSARAARAHGRRDQATGGGQ